MQPGPAFQIEQSTDAATGTVQLRLLGELDLAVVSTLTTRLAELRAQKRTVELDLSRLSFMDSIGLGTVISAVLDARRDGWSLEIQPTLTQPVQRIVEISGAWPYLWPEPHT